MKISQVAVIAYCRTGFEPEVCAEISDICGESPKGEILVKDGMVWAPFSPSVLSKRFKSWPFHEAIFSRQWVIGCLPLHNLTSGDRAQPLVLRLRELFETFNMELLYSDIWIEFPDTNEGKTLSKFAKSLQRPLENALKRSDFKRVYSKKNLPRLHIILDSYESASVGFSFPNASSPFPMGIPRLKIPKEAPSRSYLKLEEALLTFFGTTSIRDIDAHATTIVDLGAAPGGWSWFLGRQGLAVIAVDRGDLDAHILDEGRIDHRREDAFHFKPDRPAQWVVCDIVEQPKRIAELIEKWWRNQWCRVAIFNLKLPMKKRHEEVERCLAPFRKIEAESHGKAVVRCKQLYHDREEVTVALYLKRFE